MNSVMTHQFSKVPKAEIPRSVFDRSFGHKTTFDAGWLIPVYIDEALPGDTFKLRMNGFARLSTPIKPIMDNLWLEDFFFSVPIRLIWQNWHKFNGAQDNPTDSVIFTVPQMTAPNVAAGGIAEGSLSDYFGLPTGALGGGAGETSGLTFNSLWHRAYNLIWNEWFRDQNLQNSVVVDKDDGSDTYTDYVLLRRGKRHDYFTSALPWPQKGTAVNLPLGTAAPVGTSASETFTGAHTALAIRNTAGSPVGAFQMGTNAGGQVGRNTTAFTAQEEIYPTNLYADLSSATAATINSLRQAFQLQKMYERDARGGTRYTEIIKSHFGVTSPDGRLQRPEYLGGGSSPVHIHPVAMTAASSGGAAAGQQGNLAAFGTVSASGHGFTKSFTEHCVLLGLVCVRADLTYQQGVNRMFNRRTRFDFYWPALSHLGEQSILNREIYANLKDGTGAAEKDGVFGYQERYAEYRYKPSMITGKFRSNASGSLEVWHLSQNFSAQPTLNTTFIAEDPPVDRVIAVNTEPHFMFDSFFSLNCARPMPIYGVPGMMDHF